MKILFFSPFSGIWLNKSREAALAKALLDNGVEVEYLFCNGIFNPFCITMSSNSLTEKSSKERRKSVCRQCKIKTKEIIKELNCKYSFLEDYTSISHSELVNEYLSLITKSNYLEFEIDNIEVGRTALYEFLIRRKKRTFSMTETEWNDYLICLRNNITTHLCGKKFFEISSDYSAVFIQNSLYSVNRQFQYIASKCNINTYVYDNNLNLSDQMGGLIFAKESPFTFFSELYEQSWPLVKDRPLSPKKIIAVKNHINILLSSTNHYAFSSAKTLNFNTRKYFGINNDCKIVLVSTSSYDELFSAYSNKSRPTHNELNVIFSSLEEWLSALIEWARGHSNIVFIIRIHPREAQKISETGDSENLYLLRQLLKSIPENVKINWPEQNISLYNLFDDVDLVLNAWSSVGYEAILYQVPVLLYSEKITLYPSSLNTVVSSSVSDYLDAIDSTLNTELSFNHSVSVFRWYSLLFDGSYIPIKKKSYILILDSILNPKVLGKYPVRRIMRNIGFFYYRIGRIKDFKIKQEIVNNIISLIENNGNSLMDINLKNYNLNNNLKKESNLISNYLSKFKVNKQKLKLK